MANKDCVKVKFSQKRLEVLRKHFNYSLKEVAEYAGCSPTTLRRAGKAGSINEVYIDKMAEMMLCTREFLMGDKSLERVARAYETIDAYWDEAAKAIAEKKALEATDTTDAE